MQTTATEQYFSRWDDDKLCRDESANDFQVYNSVWMANGDCALSNSKRIGIIIIRSLNSNRNNYLHATTNSIEVVHCPLRMQQPLTLRMERPGQGKIGRLFSFEKNFQLHLAIEFLRRTLFGAITFSGNESGQCSWVWVRQVRHTETYVLVLLHDHSHRH